MSPPISCSAPFWQSAANGLVFTFLRRRSFNNSSIFSLESIELRHAVTVSVSLHFQCSLAYFFVWQRACFTPAWRLVLIASVRVADFLTINCGCDISNVFSHMDFQLFAELVFVSSIEDFLFYFYVKWFCEEIWLCLWYSWLKCDYLFGIQISINIT